LGLAVAKAYDVGKALWRISSGLAKFIEEGNVARKTLQEGISVLNASKPTSPATW
jgi:hypothetical protein